MKSGIVAAEALVDALANDVPEATDYRARLEKSWLWQELYGVRNIRPAFRAGLYARVSTNDQQTLPMQSRAMREYAARRGWNGS